MNDFVLISLSFIFNTVLDNGKKKFIDTIVLANGGVADKKKIF